MMQAFAWEPSSELVQSTNLARFFERYGIASYDELVRRANADTNWFCNAVIEFFDIEFDAPYAQVVEESAEPALPNWCVNGTTSIVLNCIDRFRDTPTWHKAALIAESEEGPSRTLSYAQLNDEVCRFAALLRSNGIKRDDVVGIYLPMIPEAAVAFFAVIKLGAIVLPLFSGFGPQPIADRMMHARARAIITADYAVRRGARTELVDVVDKAMGIAGIAATVFVLHREGGEGEARSASHVTWDPKSPTTASWETEILDAEAPAMLMYTSGTTGEPKGTVHTHCGMLVKNALDMSLCVDMKASDRLLWMSDMGWIAGPKMILSSALAGATLVMAEGTPTWPQSDRLFAIAEKHKVTMLGIVPTIVRQVMKTGGLAPDRDLTSLRVVVSAGEPWTDDAWWWFFDVVGKKKVPILNYAGGTECGGAILVGTLLHPLRPGSFGGPVPGCGADIVDANGKSVDAGVIGELVMRKPSIGLTRGLWRAPERYLGYWRQIPGMWVQGDLASRDSDGLWYLHGRSDDVIKIAGKRTGPAEIESIVMQTGLVKDCVVIGISDPITGSALMCVYVPVKSGEEDAGKAIGTAIAEHCGASYRPKHFLRVSDLPRTRNEKSMRRVVRSIVLDTPMGDTSSLANPAVIDEIREATRLQLPNILKAS